MNARKALLTGCFSCFLFLSASGAAHAALIPVFFSLGDESVAKAAEFPDTDDYKSAEGQFIDAGYRFKSFKLFWIPAWNYDVQWCGYVGDSGRYLDLDRETLASLASSGGVELPESPSLPFWDAYGGKLVLLGGFFVVRFVKKANA